jgi:uncharacterized phiE125 gp8 family phage protein
MPIEPLLITAPTRLAVSLVDLKTHQRIDISDEDYLLEQFIRAAADYFEWRTGRTVYETELEIALDKFPCGYIELPRAFPLLSITHIKYRDSDNVNNTWSSSAYVSDEWGRVAPAYGQTWPSFTPYPLSPVRVRYKAGIADNLSPAIYASDGIVQCIGELVGSMYANRESIVATDRLSVAAFAKNIGFDAVLSRHIVRYAF